MDLTHKIALDLTAKQRTYFVRAAGVSRFVWNWALAEWDKEYASGGKPRANALKKRFNSIYKQEFPWVADVHRDCHSQPFADLHQAFTNFFTGRARRPKFKGKHRHRASFYIANDRFSLMGKIVRLPCIGRVRMRETLRFVGKINSARVVQECGRWFLCVSVDVGDKRHKRIDDGVVGVDLGIKALATFSNGEQVDNPAPLRKAQKRLRRAQRKLSRRVRGSKNRTKQKEVVARIHRRVRNIRHDVLHKTTTKCCRENQTVVIEDLSPSNMVKNHCLAQALSDVGFGLFRQFLTYKAQIFGTRIIVADRFFPSSKKCSSCGLVKDKLSLGERVFRCPCSLQIDRDLNAALNLEALGRATPEVTPVDTRRRVVEAGTTPRVHSPAPSK